MIRKILVSMMAIASLCVGTNCSAASDNSGNITEGTSGVEQKEIPKVYLFKEITPQNLVKIYKTLGREAKGEGCSETFYRRAGWPQFPATFIN